MTTEMWLPVFKDFKIQIAQKTGKKVKLLVLIVRDSPRFYTCPGVPENMKLSRNF